MAMRRWATRCGNGVCRCGRIIGGVWQSSWRGVAIEKCLTAFPQSQRNIVTIVTIRGQ